MDGHWSNWTVGECLPKCGKGLQLKTRKCDNPSPQHNGKECLQRNNMTGLNETVAVDCYSGKCIRKFATIFSHILCFYPQYYPIISEAFQEHFSIFSIQFAFAFATSRENQRET